MSYKLINIISFIVLKEQFHTVSACTIKLYNLDSPFGSVHCMDVEIVNREIVSNHVYVYI